MDGIEQQSDARLAIRIEVLQEGIAKASGCTGTEVGKQRNRRTQIIITPKLDEFMELIGQAPDGE
jgi:hypothetical protein